MRHLLIVILIVVLQTAEANAEKIKLIGHVIDSLNNQPISLVRIFNDKGEQVAITNIKGEFEIEVDKQKLISWGLKRVGYKDMIVEYRLSAIKNQVLKIQMTQTPFMLGEVEVTGKRKQNAAELISKLAIQLPNTMRCSCYQAQGICREWRKKNGKYVFFAEGLIDHFNEGYAIKGYAYTITTALTCRISDQDFSISSVRHPEFPSLGRCSYSSILLPILLRQYYNFQITDTVQPEGHKCIVVAYKLNADKANRDAYDRFSEELYLNRHLYGKIVFNLDDFSLVKMINKGSNQSDEISYYDAKEFITTSYFIQKYGQTFLSSTKTDFTYNEYDLLSKKECEIYSQYYINYTKYDTTYISNKELQERFGCELHIDNRFGTQARFCSGIISDDKKCPKYDTEFWNNFSPVADWKKVREDLEAMSGRKLEQQFETNGSFLIAESKMKQVLRLVPKPYKRRLVYEYRDLKQSDLFSIKTLDKIKTK